ncbi:MXAN_6230/SCO0854 family RING domain-containing protein [Streptomyces nanshensis]|uniref:RING-type domain-containing protein n=1 Tax=Streptomyces nanshensis TaxID=518642 RepID=A0A1E7KZ61_9ACTN|nr:MXAN_6230/SCO0854 family RING domain-containing protein [Streptomyces nanshensis]OEV09238.1 hypothetical protein AN218_22485 [Streptomyces nanshensis]
MTTVDTITAHRPWSTSAVLLTRRGAVYPPAPSATASPQALAGVTLLESDLLDRGFLVSAELRHALAALETATLAEAGTALLADIDAALGADRPHQPLFRGFPESTPTDTMAFFVDRVLTVLLQVPEQPCILCGTPGTVHAVSPCAHLVCRSCFDGADFSACPICHRRIDTADPFLHPAATRPAASPHRALPERLRVLSLGGDTSARRSHAAAELATLLARTGALSPQDTDDLTVLLNDVGDRADLSWLPEQLPSRETKARVLAWLLDDRSAFAATLPAVTARLTTATDILRLLAVRSGGDPSLTDAPRLTSVPRPLRRALLGALDRLDPTLATEDFRRRPARWKAVAERLHPFEHAELFPRAALAFAVLRSTPLTDDALSTRLRQTADRTAGAHATADGVRPPVWAGQVEAALAAADVARAVKLLTQRPGEFVRRLNHLLCLASPADAEAVLNALSAAAPRVAPAVLLSALGEVRTRTTRRESRVFFPKGGSARAHLVADQRAPLDGAVVGRTVAVLTAEILRRAEQLPQADVAVVDAELTGLIAPFAERTASRALVTLPRGSELPVPDGRTVRLFLHWMESATSGRTDLDLSTAMFGHDWSHIATCDYTNLCYADTAAVHSGDLTSAPAPHGASEFVDLDLKELAAAGVRYVVAAVYSFNSVPFVELEDAFAGLMVRDEPGVNGPVFDARQVEQRFDLTSPAKACLPMVIDVQARTMRWLDIVQGVTGTHHAVHRHGDSMAALGRHLTALFSSGARVGLGELATWQAAARATNVVVRHLDGSTTSYGRRVGEDVAAFAARIGTMDDDATEADPSRATLAYLMRGDVELPAGSEVYALHPAGLDSSAVRLLAASEVVTGLAPE